MTTWGHLMLASLAGTRSASSEFFLAILSQPPKVKLCGGIKVERNTQKRTIRQKELHSCHQNQIQIQSVLLLHILLNKLNTYHFIRNISSPLESVAPIILSGCRPLPKPRAFSPWRQKLKKIKLKKGKKKKRKQREGL